MYLLQDRLKEPWTCIFIIQVQVDIPISVTAEISYQALLVV